MNVDSASYSVRSFVSDWSTASVSLPVEENTIFSKDQLKKKYWGLGLPLCKLEKRISALIVRLRVKIRLNNTNILSSSSVFPHCRISPCCNCLKCKCSKELSYFPSTSVMSYYVPIYFKGSITNSGPQHLCTFVKDIVLSALIQNILLRERIYICRNFLKFSNHF